MELLIPLPESACVLGRCPGAVLCRNQLAQSLGTC